MTGADAWPKRPLAEVATLQRGFDLPVQARRTGQVPIFAANGVVAFHDEAKVAGPGVVTGRSGTIGRVHYSLDDFWPLNTSLFVKDFHGNDPRYVYYLLRHLDLAQYHEGSGVPTLNRNVVHLVEVPVPPAEEQRRIAQILDHADALRRKRRQVLAHLDSLPQSIFHDMFGRVEARIPLAEALESAALFTDGDWVESKDQDQGGDVRLTQLADVGDGAWLNKSNRFMTSAKAKELRCTYLEEDDILVARMPDPLGRACIFPGGDRPCVTVVDVCVIRLDRDCHEPAWLAAAINAPATRAQIQRLATGTTRSRVSRGNLSKVLIPGIPLVEQREFAARIARVEQDRTLARRVFAAHDELFASLQSRAFRGEL